MTVGKDNDMRQDKKEKKIEQKQREMNKRIASRRMDTKFYRGEERRCKQKIREHSVFAFRQKTACA